uniref:Uncharacterized protein n=1 Tax=Peronospora matthiolae TaxID=2874970 RepID=A0AAV1UXL8_9STRA
MVYTYRQRGAKEGTSTFSSMKFAPFEGDHRHVCVGQGQHKSAKQSIQACLIRIECKWAHRSSEDEGWFASGKCE